ncbi:Alpha/Beta hydrolase protein [Mycena alexandri]|uniref:Alpha/Beta hydrolase protein n=1 Tax=Mycena alexandri TaxID=1745969 RepID=A0AAD6X560_9AGAR|nr:Alpha/Beta hydrolase protein [Mycena alexandri]
MKHTTVVAGLEVQVFTTDAFKTSTKPILALFVLHGRLGSTESENVRSLITTVVKAAGEHEGEKDLMIVAFDHRNHGTRLRSKVANLGFEENDNHASDMYSILAKDVSFLIDFLESYLFPAAERRVVEWGVAGISLGGHSAWMVAAADPRVTLVVPIIGCPDYLGLIEARATALGIAIGPPHFPDSLMKVLKAKALTALPYRSTAGENPFLGKKVLVLSGGSDPVVPWAASRAFVEGLEVGPRGSKEVKVFEGVGHAVGQGMVDGLVAFVLGDLACGRMF